MLNLPLPRDSKTRQSAVVVAQTPENENPNKNKKINHLFENNIIIKSIELKRAARTL